MSDNKKKVDKLLSYSFKVDEFAMRGLNKYRNFMYDSNRTYIPLKNEDELRSFCSNALIENGCSNSAIFLVNKTGEQRVFYSHAEWDKEYEEVDCQISLYSSKKLLPAEFFAQFDAEKGLHCYALMIERDNNIWEICK